MQILASSLVGKDVFSVHNGHNIGKIKSWIVNYQDLKIGFLTVSTDKKTTKYLLSEDIRSLGSQSKNIVIIDSEDSLSDKEDLIRHRESIEKGQNLIGFRVKTSSGRPIGKVKDLSVDFQDLYILKLHIQAKFPQRLLQSILLVDRNDIVKIKKGVVVIKNGFIKTQSTVKKALPA